MVLVLTFNCIKGFCSELFRYGEIRLTAEMLCGIGGGGDCVVTVAVAPTPHTTALGVGGKGGIGKTAVKGVIFFQEQTYLRLENRQWYVFRIREAVGAIVGWGSDCNLGPPCRYGVVVQHAVPGS